MPMRAFYPTARFLGIVASGEFTRPARELVTSRKIDLFYVPKAKVLQAFRELGLEADYDDRAPETVKQAVAATFDLGLGDAKKAAADSLRALIGETDLLGYIHRVQAALSSTPQELRIIGLQVSRPVIFETVNELSDFLRDDNPRLDFSEPEARYTYEVTYSDGGEFERTVANIDDLRQLHGQIAALAAHMTTLAQR